MSLPSGRLTSPGRVACDQAYPGALLLALGICAYAKMRGSPTPVGKTLGAQLQLDPRKRRRALAGLEAAGLVLVERRPNRVPRATLAPWPPQDGTAIFGRP